MPLINLTPHCHVAIISIVHCWEVVKRDIAGQYRKSGGGVLLTGIGPEYSDFVYGQCFVQGRVERVVNRRHGVRIHLIST